MPLGRARTKSAGVPPPGELFGSAGPERFLPIYTPIAGETTRLILAIRKKRSQRLPQLLANRDIAGQAALDVGPLCNPLDNSKLPMRMAPAVSNSFSNSSAFQHSLH